MARQGWSTERSGVPHQAFRFVVAADVLSMTLRLGTVVAVAWFINDAIHALAAETTTANIGVRFLADVRGSQFFAWLAGAGGVVWGYSERYLRIKATKRQGRHIEELEKLLDPNRSSSDYEGG